MHGWRVKAVMRMPVKYRVNVFESAVRSTAVLQAKPFVPRAERQIGTPRNGR